jgi:hypothetical protein
MLLRHIKGLLCQSEKTKLQKRHALPKSQYHEIALILSNRPIQNQVPPLKIILFLIRQILHIVVNQIK